jgi:plastocyanin
VSRSAGRGLCGAVTVSLLLLGATALPTGPVQFRAGEARAADCIWQRHGKRVVKRVRRHGKVRKMVRRKHWWTCVPQAATPAAATLVPTPPPPLAPEPELEANRLSVKASEYYFILSRPKVKPGSVTVELNNQGEDPHNLNLRREGDESEPLQIPETESLQRNVAGFDLPGGKYRLWCSLPEHEERGMETTLVVE